ncbi:MAG: hypothetical protein JXQ29_01465 [Planctomycetes bacterium]|nr:hypothetical protein [Planctomycetota bacterium]
MNSMRMLARLVSVLGLLAVAAVPQERPPEIPPAQRPAARAAVVAKAAEAILDRLARDGDFQHANREAVKLFERVIAHAPLDEPELFRRACLTQRLIRLLGRHDETKRLPLLDYLRRNDHLASALAFAVKSGDRVAGVLEVVERLREAHGPHLDPYGNLVAALAVVHDSGGAAGAAHAVQLFEYYVRHEKQMLYGIRHLPPELLVHVVDTPAGVEELEWALEKYAGDTNVGERYSDVPFDEMHRAQGTTKRIAGHPYTLENLRKLGGICSDQAYFASNVGKAIGVPAVAAGGKAGDQAHAWVGFFESRGTRKGKWNFESGRTFEFRQVRGWVLEPQLGQHVPESHIAVLAEMVGTTPAGRQQALTFVDAAHRLSWMRRMQQTASHEPLLPGAEDAAPRAMDEATQLLLIETGLRKNPACAEGWEAVAALARGKQLSAAAVREWAARLDRMCGRDYPDFSADILKSLVASLEDVDEQNRSWENAIRYFRRRLDLAAELRMDQARMWEKAGRADRAAACYQDLLENHANDGLFVLTALERAERLLRAGNQAARVPALYEQTWSRIRMPEAAHNKRASNWYLVGAAYLRVLEEFKDRARAEWVRSRLRKVAG